jgi:hypothetical protein
MVNKMENVLEYENARHITGNAWHYQFVEIRFYIAGGIGSSGGICYISLGFRSTRMAMTTATTRKRIPRQIPEKPQKFAVF